MYVHTYCLFYRSHQQSVIDVAAANNINDARPVFDSLDWTEESYRMFERIGQTGQQFYLCASSVEVSM